MRAESLAELVRMAAKLLALAGQAIGLESQAQLNADHCRIPTIFITGHGDAKMRMEAMRASAVEFWAKPFHDEVLVESVRAAMES
jgi:FixJ family two-component response regulator